MKPLIISTASLLVGVAIGCYVGYSYCDRHVTNEAVEQMLQGMESSDGEHAARAVRVIELIDSGENQKAVQMLSRPIADYYSSYAIHAGIDREQKTRAMIEQLASTNKIVADAITNEMRGKIQ